MNCGTVALEILSQTRNAAFTTVPTETVVNIVVLNRHALQLTFTARNRPYNMIFQVAVSHYYISGCNIFQIFKFLHFYVTFSISLLITYRVTNCKGTHTINTANVGSTRDLISQNKMRIKAIDFKADTM